MSSGKKKILVVDDSSTMRQLVKMMVTKYTDCSVKEAADGQEAFEVLGGEAFDLVITDINMPRMSGLDLVRKLRSEAGDKTPVIMLTTQGADKDRELGMQRGADAYLSKPVNGPKLAEAIRSLTG